MNILEQLGEKIAKTQIKYPSIFMIGMILVLLATLPGVLLLISHVEPSLEKILPQQVEEVKTMNDMRAQFGADMMYIVIKADGPTYDVRNTQSLKYIDVLSNKLRERQYILEVNNLADLIKQTNQNYIPESNQEIKELLKLHPQTGMYLNHDYSTTMIRIRSDTGATSSIIEQVVNDIEDDILSLEQYNPGLALQITGFNSIDKATFEVIIQDFAKITLFSFTFMVAFLLLYFRSVRKVIASISVIMLSVLITLGITGYLNITITVVTMVAAAMIMALGISYGINTIYDYFLLRKKLKKGDALIELEKGLIRALVGSSLTTTSGFLALLFGIIPAMKNLGIVLAIGILITLLVSVLILPVIILLLDNNKGIIRD